MTEEEKLEIALAIAGGAECFLRGLWLDPRLPANMKQAIMDKANDIADSIHELTDEN